MNNPSPEHIMHFLKHKGFRGMAAAVFFCSAGCSGPQEIPAPPCEAPPIQGERAAFTLAGSAVTGVQVGEPISCDEKPDVYIPLKADGPRKIVMGRGDIKGYAGCSPEDALAGPADACPNIQFDLFAQILSERMVARGATPAGAGLGVCGDINADYDGWNASVAVLDWAHANIAIEEAARLMNELQIGNAFGISVTHPVCGIALEAE